jgi:hypothetical protein
MIAENFGKCAIEYTKMIFATELLMSISPNDFDVGNVGSNF